MSAINILAAFENEPPPLDYVLPGFLLGTVGLITAPGATGKSFLAMQLSMAICGAKADLLGLNLDRHGKSLYFGLEDPPPVVNHRLHAIGKHFAPDTRQLVADNFELNCLVGDPIDIMNEKWQENLQADCKRLSPRLIVIDTLSRAHQLDENSNPDMARLVKALEGIAARANVSILMVHHTAKSMATQGRGDEQQSSRGASALSDNSRWHAFLAGMTKEEAAQYGVADDCRKNFIRFGVPKNNNGAPFTELWFRRHEGGVLLPAHLGEKKKQGRGRIVA